MLTVTDRRVLNLLAFDSDLRDDSTWLGEQQISDTLMIPISAVETALSRLREFGYIGRDGAA